jgi:hypothetical protein
MIPEELILANADAAVLNDAAYLPVLSSASLHI